MKEFRFEEKSPGMVEVGRPPIPINEPILGASIQVPDILKDAPHSVQWAWSVANRATCRNHQIKREVLESRREGRRVDDRAISAEFAYNEILANEYGKFATQWISLQATPTQYVVIGVDMAEEWER